MAEVFLARQVGLEGFDRRVAVKRILPHLADSGEFVSMFLREAKLAARLSHPNIVHIYEFGKVGLDYFIAMEFVDGVTVGELIARAAKDPVPPALVARIGADAATALHYAHELRGDNGKPLGLVHRDVSPANVMVSYDGIVKLVDFGIAKAVELTGDKTNPGTVKGKYAYMSPEQTIAAHLDGRSDVFSLAIVLWELVVGRPIVERGDRVAAMRAIRDGRLPALDRVSPHTPKALTEAINAGLARRREDRPNAAELAHTLESFIKASPELATAMHVAAWLRPRFAPPLEQVSETAGGGVMATAVGTAPGAPSTQAAQTDEDLAATIPVQRMTAAELYGVGVVPRPAAPAAPAVALSSPGIGRGPAAVVTTESVQALPAPARPPAITAAELVSAPAGPPMRARPQHARANLPPARADEPTEASLRVRRRIAIAVVAAALIASAFAITRFVVQPYLNPRAPAPSRPAPQVQPIGASPSAPAPSTGATVEPITEPTAAPPTTPPPLASRTDTPPPSKIEGRMEMSRTDALVTGWISVRTEPMAEVYLGSRFLGRTPTADIELAAGTHTLTFKAPGRTDLSREITIRADEKLELKLDL